MSATGRSSKRRTADGYPTPAEALDVLGEYWPALYRGGRILEPSCGDGNVIAWVRQREPGAVIDAVDSEIPACRATAIRLLGVQELQARDYLELPAERRYRLIIGNPPYRLAQAFADHALGMLEVGGALVFLLRLNFLGSQRRSKWWQGGTLARVIVLSRRPSFTGRGTDATEYAWFIWRPGHAGPVILEVR